MYSINSKAHGYRDDSVSFCISHVSMNRFNFAFHFSRTEHTVLATYSVYSVMSWAYISWKEIQFHFNEKM